MRRVIIALSAAALALLLTTPPALAGGGGPNPEATRFNWGVIWVTALIVLGALATGIGCSKDSRRVFAIFGIVIFGLATVVASATGKGFFIDTEAGRHNKAMEYCNGRFFNDPWVAACVAGYLHNPNNPPAQPVG